MNSDKLPEIRCQKCNKLLLAGVPGYDFLGKAKILEVKCPRCGAMNLISIKVIEEIKIELKGD